jgi:YegS/Rv2252/BmrU family lipid kinase
VKVLLLVNSTASSVTARTQVVVQRALSSADYEVRIAETSRRGHAMRLAQGAAADGVDVVVVLGGDGTLNEAANGLAGSRTALGVLPGGSTNVFARSIGIKNDPIEATSQLLEALQQQSYRRIGLGSVNDRYFLFHVGMGFDAAVVEQVERRSTIKRFASHPLFVYAGFATWFRHYDRTRPRLTVSHAGPNSIHTLIDDAYLAICLNSNPYTFLGRVPLSLVPEATLDRGLAVVVFRTLKLASMLSLIYSALRGGERLRNHRRIHIAHDLTEFKVDGHGPFPYQVDGDFLGETESLRLRWEPESLTLVQPLIHS